MSNGLPSADQRLIQIVDAELAGAVQKSGSWLACRIGCTQCCIGVFEITQLDAARLRVGLEQLESTDPECAARVRRRVAESLQRLAANFPGDVSTGVLSDEDDTLAAFDEYGNDEPCPALDPATGACDLYGHRPMTCRIFGPPVRTEEGIGVCELCFVGASESEIAACEMQRDPENLEDALIAEAEQASGLHGETLVAFALRDSRSWHSHSEAGFCDDDAAQQQ
jgi:Fe-S-cluster containining protein